MCYGFGVIHFVMVEPGEVSRAIGHCYKPYALLDSRDRSRIKRMESFEDLFRRLSSDSAPLIQKVNRQAIYPAPQALANTFD